MTEFYNKNTAICIDFFCAEVYNGFDRISAFRRNGEVVLMNKIRAIDPTRGRIVPSMILYALPIAMGSLLQTLFTACDLVVVRMMADSTAVASVGATSTVTHLFVTSFVGVATGVNIILARMLGAREHDRVRRLIPTALLVALILGSIVGCVGFFFGDDILRFMNCPDECYSGATTYIIVYMLSAPFILLYNFASTIIRVSGDSVRPTVYLVIAGVVNVVLNFVLCLLLSNKVLAVALATVSSQVIGAALCIVRLMRMDGACRFSFKTIVFDFDLCKKVLLYGIPGAISNATFAISGLQIQGTINSYGSSAIAGNTATSSLEGIASCMQTGINSSIAVFVGQNIGAQKPQRVRQSLLLGLLLDVCAGVLGGGLIFLFKEPLLSLYVGTDVAAKEMGVLRMHYIAIVNYIFYARGALTSSLNAFGYSKFSMVQSLLCIVVFRLLWMNFIYPLHPTPSMVYLSFPISGVLGVLVAGTMLLFVYRRYQRGRLSKI